jgi:hypothetical protein
MTSAFALLLPVIVGFDYQSSPDLMAETAASVLITPQQNGEPQNQDLPGNTLKGQGEKDAQPSVLAQPGDKARLPGILAQAEAKPAPEKTGQERDTVLSWETGAGKSYLYPALEIPTFLVLLNLYDRVVYPDDREEGKRTYSSTFSSTWKHLTKQDWAYDRDPFNVNQFAHPYQGATMYGLARSCGLGFWESWAYSNAGSFLWKMAGETDRPSINDMATTGNSGSLLGEALFRMSALVLGQNNGRPDGWHELGAAVISPTTAVNRYLFGERFRTVFPSHDPATFWRFRFGASLNSSSDATFDFGMSYGLPGKPGYTYIRPLDYFDFQIAALAREKNPVGNVLLRGLLYGTRYEVGENYRGIWGIYGSYDYISPTIFRVSTTALSLGTTGQYWVAPGIALQGSLLGGAGFGAAGVTPAADGKRDYHYGLTPQGLLALRLLFGNRTALETVGRAYYVSGTGSDNLRGSETIFRINANLIFRVYKRHGLGVQLVESIRDAQYGNLPARHQSDATVGLFYTFLGDSHFGAVEWRNLGDR